MIGWAKKFQKTKKDGSSAYFELQKKINFSQLRVVVNGEFKRTDQLNTPNALVNVSMSPVLQISSCEVKIRPTNLLHNTFQMSGNFTRRFYKTE